MKKLLCLFLSAIIFTSLCISPAFAISISQDQSFTVDTPYEYPVTPGTSAWNELNSLDEKVTACHVDEKLLTSMTTPALLETVLNYPLLVNMFAFNSIQTGIESVSQYFPCLPLLLARKDLMECISSYSQLTTYSENDTESLVRHTCLIALERYISESEISPYISTPGGSPVASYYNLTWSDHGWTQSQAQANQNALASLYPNATVVYS